MTDSSSPDTEREALARRLELAPNSVMRLSGRTMPISLDAVERDMLVAALRSARSSAGIEQKLRLALQRIVDNRNNKNWRKPEICDEAERALSQRDVAQPPCGRAGGNCECTSIDECARAFAQANQE